MFTKTITRYVCLLGALTLLFTSCQEDPETETAASAPLAKQADIAVENGMLHFKDESVWAATIEKMQGTENYNAYVASLGFENSLLNKYEAIKESDEVLDDYFEQGKLPKIWDDLFASLLNEQAMVKIGETLYKVTDEYTFSVVDKDGDMRKQFEDGSSLEKLSKVSTFENIDALAGKTLVVEGEEDGVETSARFQGDEWVIRQHGHFRAKLGAWSRTYGLYSSVGIKLVAERWRKGGLFGTTKWRDDESDYLYVYGEALTKLCRPLSCDDERIETGGAFKYKSHRVEKIIDGIGLPIPGAYWHVTDYIDGTYQYRFDANEPLRTATIRFE